MDDEKSINRIIKRIKRAVIGNALDRLGYKVLDRLMESTALNKRIPYSFKKSLADDIYERIRTERDSVSGPLRTLRDYVLPSSVAVHMHHNEWEGIEYKIWEEKSLTDGDSSYSVFFPGIRFPYFNLDESLAPEWPIKRKNDDLDRSSSNRICLDINVVEFSIWQGILYQHPLFGKLESSKRPDLSDSWTFDKNIPYKGVPKKVRVPVFESKSLASANAEARAVVDLMQEYGEPMGKILNLLRKDENVRREFLDKSDDIHTQELLTKYGLKIDILPHVVRKSDGSYGGVSYSIYEIKGGILGGQEHKWAWGFAHGLKFPDFGNDKTLSKEENRALEGSMELIFDYALYGDEIFRPKGGIISYSTPNLVDKFREEARIARVNEIPDGYVVPFDSSPYPEHIKDKFENTIRVYNQYRPQVEEIVQKLSLQQVREDLLVELHGHWVSEMSDGVADVLGKHGAKFISQNPYHLRRKRDIEESVKNFTSSNRSNSTYNELLTNLM